MKRITICVLATAGLVADCGASSPEAAPTVTPAAASTSTSPDCPTVTHQWYTSAGGGAGLSALGRDCQAVARDDSRIGSSFASGGLRQKS